MAGLDLGKFIDGTVNNFGDIENNEASLLCPVCKCDKVFINRANPVTLYTSHGCVDYNVITCEAKAHDLMRKDFRGVIIGLICGNGHDFMLGLKYLLSYESMKIDVLLSDYSEAVKYPEAYRKEFMIYDDESESMILDQERFDKEWNALQARHIEEIKCQEYENDKR